MKFAGLVNALQSPALSLAGRVRHIVERAPQFLKRLLKRTRRVAWKAVARSIVPLGDILYRIRPFTIGTFSAHRIGHISAEIGIELAERATRKENLSGRSRDFRAIDPQEPVANEYLLAVMALRFCHLQFLWPIIAILRRAGVSRPWLVDPEGSFSRDRRGMLSRYDGSYGFSEEENDVARNYLTSLGWSGGQPIVCLLVRDAHYLDSAPGLTPSEVGKSWGYHDYRDSDVATYMQAVRWLAESGAFVLRMGKLMAKPLVLQHKNFVDYAFTAERSDFLDVWLFANCSLCITTSTGPDQISVVHRRPVLAVNHLPMMDILSSAHLLSAPKRLFWRESASELSLSDYASACWYRADAYVSAGVEVRALAGVEILEVVQEAWSRLNGTWTDDAEALALNQAAWDALEREESFLAYHDFRHPEARFSSAWLRGLQKQLPG